MTQHIYTQAEIDALSALATEAQQIEELARAELANAEAVIDRVVGTRYIGWEVHYTEQLGGIIDGIHQQFQVAPYSNWMPKVGQFTSKPQRVSEWQKINNRAQREIAKLQKAIAAHA